jgi:methylthioribose-1-phosphate isomerase
MPEPQPIPTLAWVGEPGQRPAIRILDQTRLPRAEVYVDLSDVASLCEAVYALRVRGAPAIGIAGAYGVALAAHTFAAGAATTARDGLAQVREAAAAIRAVRPTAVNLGWAVDRTLRKVAVAAEAAAPMQALATAALDEARAIHAEDLAMSRAMGQHGAALLASNARILTHCNTGGLATGGLGTALAVVFTAAAAGKRPHVFVDETRPLLQGARLTMWELARAGIGATLIVDGAAAWAMKCHSIDAVLVGADRVAANGDAANKIGTYGLAIAAARHNVPFYVVAPSSTFDAALPTGDGIPIEERPAAEVLAEAEGGATGTGAALSAVSVWNPAFDVTPAELITGWVTEAGVRRHGDFA